MNHKVIALSMFLVNTFVWAMNNVTAYDKRHIPVTNEILDATAKRNFYKMSYYNAETPGNKKYYRILWDYSERDLKKAIQDRDAMLPLRKEIVENQVFKSKL
jgi:hypothetical protein